MNEYEYESLKGIEMSLKELISILETSPEKEENINL